MAKQSKSVYTGNWRGLPRTLNAPSFGGRTLAKTKSSGGGGNKKGIRKVWYVETGTATQQGGGGKGRPAPRVISRCYPEGEAPWTELTNTINAAKKK